MFLGHRDDVPDVLAPSTSRSAPPDFEGTPLSVMEYMEAAARWSRPGWAGSPT